jgi:hypothetical protein
MSLTYTAVPEVSEDGVLFLSALLCAGRERWGTRASGTYEQAVLVLRRLLEDARMSALVRDKAISGATAYEYGERTSR